MALNAKILAILADSLEFDDGEMDGLVTALVGIVNEQTAPLNERIAELEAASTAAPKVKKAAKKASGGAKKAPNAYSKFVKVASAISKDEAEDGIKDIAFTPTAPTADKAVARWSSAPADLIDFTAECTLEHLIKTIKGCDEFSNLMVASSLAWNMIPDTQKTEITTAISA